MKIYTSYFYKIRFFTHNMIPISTAKWDPKWYYKGVQGKVYKDKRGIYNGIRADILVLPEEYWSPLVEKHEECTQDCPHKVEEYCGFMKAYRSYLDTLDFHDIVKRCESIGERVKAKEGFIGEPIIVLMVHEPDSCNCAERPVLQDWFNDNGYPIEEWYKDA